MIPQELLPTDPEERKRVEEAWSHIFKNIPVGESFTIAILEAGETLVSLKLGQIDGLPVAYMTKTSAAGKQHALVGKWRGNS